MPLIPALGVLFIALKLTGVIAWSWLWVLAPFWLGLVGMLVVMLTAALGVASFVALGAYLTRR